MQKRRPQRNRPIPAAQNKGSHKHLEIFMRLCRKHGISWGTASPGARHQRKKSPSSSSSSRGSTTSTFLRNTARRNGRTALPFFFSAAFFAPPLSTISFCQHNPQ